MNTTPIRSVLLETRTYRDSAGQANTSALLSINGAFVAAFPLQYGSPEVLEEYTARPYLEALGVLTPGDRYRALGNRVRATGADYYRTEAVMKKGDCFKHAHSLTAAEFWQELAYRESRRVLTLKTAEDIARAKKDPKKAV